ncbi:hypothetical protein [Acinetobacter towneri]
MSENDIGDFIESGDTEKLRKILTEKFRELIEQDLPKYIQILESELL